MLATVETVLAGFESRRDLPRHRRELANGGIAGTEIRYELFYPTAVALARRFPGRLRVDWRAWGTKRGSHSVLGRSSCRTRRRRRSTRCGAGAARWIDFLVARVERDGVFLALRFTAIDASSFVREVIYDSLSPAMVLEPGPGTAHANARKGTGREGCLSNRDRLMLLVPICLGQFGVGGWRPGG